LAQTAWLNSNDPSLGRLQDRDKNGIAAPRLLAVAIGRPVDKWSDDGGGSHELATQAV
jgi:hypothetical protein